MPGQFNPESILEENFESQRQQIQKQFQTQWNEINRQAQENLFKSPKEHEQALHKLYVQSKQIMSDFNFKAAQGINQLKQIDQLAEQGAIDNPDEVKRRIVLGPEAERDPRDEYREILTTENMVLKRVQEFTRGNDGKVYAVKVDEDGFLTDQPDKTQPANEQEIEGWVADTYALGALGQAKIKVAQQVTSMSVQDPNRLQNLFQDQMQTKEIESWFNRNVRDWWPETKFRLAGGSLEDLKRIRAKKGGTFAQKVASDIYTKSGPSKRQRAPQLQELKPVGKKLTKEVARALLLEFGNRTDAMAAAKERGYTE
jgi:hypothetical protein